jgi:hypothetical protein
MQLLHSNGRCLQCYCPTTAGSIPKHSTKIAIGIHWGLLLSHATGDRAVPLSKQLYDKLLLSNHSLNNGRSTKIEEMFYEEWCLLGCYAMWLL